MLSRCREGKDDGFTLVELLITMTVLAIVMGGLVAVMFGTLTTDLSTKLRMDETRDQQFAAAYFGNDAQAARTILTSGSARCGTGTVAVEFEGTSYDPVSFASTITIVSYVFSTTTVKGTVYGQLRRQSCEGAALPLVLDPAKAAFVAKNLVSTAPSAVCSPGACGSGSLSVTLTLNRRVGDLADTQFQLVGTRRTTP